MEHTTQPSATTLLLHSMETFYIERREKSEHFDMPEHHRHINYEIYYLLSGERNYFIRDRTYRIVPGCLVFVGEYDLHRTTNAELGPAHERILISFNKEYWGSDMALLTSGFSPFLAQTPIIALNIAQRQFAEKLMGEMLEESAAQRTGYEHYMRALLVQLFLFAARLYEQNPTLPASQPPQQQKVNQLLQHINAHFIEPITLADLSSRFHISPYYMSRMFRKTTGFSIMEYVTAVRLKEAQRLLRDTALSVTEVCAESGFGDLVHFGRTFKTHTGFTPQQYRKHYADAP